MSFPRRDYWKNVKYIDQIKSTGQTWPKYPWIKRIYDCFNKEYYTSLLGDTKESVKNQLCRKISLLNKMLFLMFIYGNNWRSSEPPCCPCVFCILWELKQHVTMLFFCILTRNDRLIRRRLLIILLSRAQIMRFKSFIVTDI